MHRDSAGCAVLAAVLATAPSSAVADLVGLANSVRSGGCGASSVADRPLRAHPQLDEAARRIADGDKLDEATSGAGYQAEESAYVHVSTPTGDDGVAQMLARRFCDIVADPAFHEIGVYAHGKDTWLVFAAPFVTPDQDEIRPVRHRVLQLINDARADGRRCGRKTFSAARPLMQVAALDDAALAHAEDMAASGRLGHEGSDGSMPADRVVRANYAWSAVAENVAAGQSTAEKVVSTWVNSPGHCANLMNPRYSETGIAYAIDPTGEKGIYWVQVFAAPN